MKHEISSRWLANPDQGRAHFPHNFQSPHEYLIHIQSEDSPAHIGHIGPPNNVDY